NRAIGDRVVQELMVHVSAESPSIGERTRKSDLDEWIERRTRLIQIIDPVVVPDELPALPRETRADDERARRLYDRRRDCGADLVAVVLAGDFSQSIELADEVAELEQPLGPRQVRRVPIREDELAPGLAALLREARHQGARHIDSERRARDEHVLQIVADEKHAIVPRRRDHIERVSTAFVQREAEFEVLEKEALAVVADLRQEDERDIRMVDDRIRPLPVADAETDVQLADDD